MPPNNNNSNKFTIPYAKRKWNQFNKLGNTSEELILSCWGDSSEQEKIFFPSWCDWCKVKKNQKPYTTTVKIWPTLSVSVLIFIHASCIYAKCWINEYPSQTIYIQHVSEKELKGELQLSFVACACRTWLSKQAAEFAILFKWWNWL